jgi:hypothetical protein
MALFEAERVRLEKELVMAGRSPAMVRDEASLLMFKSLAWEKSYGLDGVKELARRTILPENAERESRGSTWMIKDGNAVAPGESNPKIAPVVEIDPAVIPVDWKDTKALTRWLRKQYQEVSVTIADDGTIQVFNRDGLESSAKKRGENQRKVYAGLDVLLKNAVYDDFVEADARHPALSGQNIYYSAMQIVDNAGNSQFFSVRFKIDIHKNKTPASYKDHKVSEIQIAPSLYRGQSVPGGVTQTESAIRGISLSVLKGDVKPSRIKDGILYQPAFHGSPTRGIERMNTDFIGTGEGNQSFGWGLYFAGVSDTAEDYRIILSRRHGLIPYIVLPNDERVSFAAPDLDKRLEGTGINGRYPDVSRDIAWAINNGSESLRAAERLLSSEAYRLERDGQPAESRRYADAVNALLELERKGLKEAERGQLYEVDIPDDDMLLDWDKPFSEQPEKVREAILSVVNRVRPFMEDYAIAYTPTDEEWAVYMAYDSSLIEEGDHNDGIRIERFGEKFYENLSSLLGSGKDASLYLNSLGIPGLRYLDGTSRGQGEGSHNFVIWSDNAVEILKTYYQSGDQSARGSVHLSNTRDIVSLFTSQDASTVIHESAHIFLNDMERVKSEGDAPRSIMEDYGKIREFVGATEGFSFTREQHEMFARAFEAYMSEAVSPAPELDSVFHRFGRWLSALFQGAEEKFILPPVMKEVFDRLLAGPRDLDCQSEDECICLSMGQ